jgi:hypothetical protein
MTKRRIFQTVTISFQTLKKLRQFKERIDTLIELYGPDAELEFEENEYEDLAPVIRYYRLETDSEMNDRIRREERAAERRKKNKEETEIRKRKRDLEIYERVKQELENEKNQS